MTPAPPNDALRQLAERLHHKLAAAQNLPYEDGDVCEECKDFAAEIIELLVLQPAPEPPTPVIGDAALKLVLTNARETLERHVLPAFRVKQYLRLEDALSVLSEIESALVLVATPEPTVTPAVCARPA